MDITQQHPRSSEVESEERTDTMYNGNRQTVLAEAIARPFLHSSRFALDGDVKHIIVALTLEDRRSAR